MFFEVFFVENVEFNFFWESENNRRQVFTGQVASEIFGQILEATFYWRQVKLPQVSAGWITTNKVDPLRVQFGVFHSPGSLKHYYFVIKALPNYNNSYNTLFDYVSAPYLVKWVWSNNSKHSSSQCCVNATLVSRDLWGGS